MSDQLDYVAVAKCGCVLAWCSSRTQPKELAKDIAGWVRGGMSVERMTTADAREKLGRNCDACKKAK